MGLNDMTLRLILKIQLLKIVNINRLIFDSILHFLLGRIISFDIFLKLISSFKGIINIILLLKVLINRHSIIWIDCLVITI
jgi:hypothetical protein